MSACHPSPCVQLLHSQLKPLVEGLGPKEYDTKTSRRRVEPARVLGEGGFACLIRKPLSCHIVPWPQHTLSRLCSLHTCCSPWYAACGPMQLLHACMGGDDAGMQALPGKSLLLLKECLRSRATRREDPMEAHIWQFLASACRRVRHHRPGQQHQVRLRAGHSEGTRRGEARVRHRAGRRVRPASQGKTVSSASTPRELGTCRTVRIPLGCLRCHTPDCRERLWLLGEA